jgi:hypothetical protein
MNRDRVSGGIESPGARQRLRSLFDDPTFRATVAWFLTQAVIVVSAGLLYFLVRGAMNSETETALRNAERVVDLQKALGIFWEPAWQSAIEDSDALVTLFNWIYLYGHWPVIIASAAWFALWFPDEFRLTRNAFLISGAIGIIIFITFPTAPPRLTDLEVVDTVTEYTSAYRLLQPPALTNPYAAVPSLHFGWNLLIGIAYIKQGPNLGVKAIGVMLPIAMFFAIVLTANHWILDAVAGAIVALAGLAIAYRITKPGDPNEPTPAQRIARAWAQR